MRLEKGDVIKTALSDNTTVLDVKDNQAIMFSGTQFVIATGIKASKESGKFEWDNGRYADDLKSISNMQNNSFEAMKDTLSFLAEYNHSDFVKSIISLETGVNNEVVLDDAYDNYMKDSAMGLIDEKFLDFVDEELTKEQERSNNDQEKSQSQKDDKEKESKQERVQDKGEKVEAGKETGVNNSEKTEEEKSDEDRISLDGNLVKDVEIKELKSKSGEMFKVASLTIAQNNENGDVKFTNCFAYNNKVDKVKDFKKGDFVHLFGKEKISYGKDGKEFKNIDIYSARLIKAREQNKQNNVENTKEEKRPSAMGKLKDYKDKTSTKSKDKESPQRDKGVDR